MCSLVRRDLGQQVPLGLANNGERIASSLMREQEQVDDQIDDRAGGHTLLQPPLCAFGKGVSVESGLRELCAADFLRTGIGDNLKVSARPRCYNRRNYNECMLLWFECGKQTSGLRPSRDSGFVCIPNVKLPSVHPTPPGLPPAFALRGFIGSIARQSRCL